MSKHNTATEVAQQAFNQGLDFLSNLISNGKGEVGRAVKTARQQGKKTAKNFRKTVDGIIANAGVTEIRRKAVDVLSQIRVENVIEDGAIENVVGMIRDNVSSTVTKLQDLEVVEYAKVKMMSALQIPSHADVEQLTRKLAALEKKLNTIKRHDARH
jgi:hypothetical protein